jgi:hypothetical protein
MSDFRYVGTVNGAEPTERDFNVVAGTTASIAIGDVVVIANGYAAKVADGGCAAAGFYGLATSASDETAAANGTVRVQFVVGDALIVRGAPTTASNLAAAILFDRVSMDVDGNGVQTVDENDPNAAYALFIWDYDDADDTIDVALLNF